MSLNPVLRAALAGAATGSRSFTPLAALVVSLPSSSDKGLEGFLAKPAVKAIVIAGAGGELVADKLPVTGSRTSFPPILGRVFAAAAVGALTARAGKSNIGVSIAVAVVAALATSYLGVAWRSKAAELFGKDLYGAVIEDVAAIATTVVVVAN